MFKTLPLEVLEYLCLYANVEDIVNIWDAVGMEGSESFWRKICKRHGYIKMRYENSLWKNVFQRNVNWLTQRYVKRTYKIEPNVIDVWQTGSHYNELHFIGKHLIANSIGEETLVWDLRRSPSLVQSFSAKFISCKGNKIVTYNLSEVAVYSYNTPTFMKVYELPVKLPSNFHKFCSFNEDYLVAFDRNTSCIKVIDLGELTESSLMTSITMSRLFSLTLSNNFLSVLTVEESNYKVKMFNLIDRVWLQDLVLFQSAALIGVPQLEMGSSMIVSWSNLLEVPGVTPVKVFGLDGKYIASLPFTNFLQASGTKLVIPVDDILWMIVECDYLIFSTSKTSVSIWYTENLNYIKVIPKEGQFYNGQKVVSSSLLVLSYSYCFKVIDFTKSVYLYEILMDNKYSQNSFQSINFFANEYSYLHFQYVQEDKDNTKLSNDKVLPLSSSLNNSDSKNINKKKCFVYIYDFSGTCS